MRQAIFPVAAAALAAVAGPVWGQAADPGAEAGRAEFMSACAACHGEDAPGDGPTAALLNVDVPDLTRIAWRNEGVLDTGRLLLTSGRRAGPSAPGGPMPMFGGLRTSAHVQIEAA